MTLQNPNSKSKRILTTMYCPHCGAHCLPKNYAAHLKKIHPDVVETDRIWTRILKNRPTTPNLRKSVKSKLEKITNAKQKPTPKVVIYKECPVCGCIKDEQNMTGHISSHTYNAPLNSPNEVHCPYCGLNILYRNLISHLFIAHSTLTDNEIIKIIRGFPKYSEMMNQESVFCYLCQIQIKSSEFENHILSHRYYRPIMKENLVRCPICSELTSYLTLKEHIKKDHPDSANGNLKKLVQKARHNDVYGFTQFHTEKSVLGEIQISSKNWVLCPLCSGYIRLKHVERHYLTSHDQTSHKMAVSAKKKR